MLILVLKKNKNSVCCCVYIFWKYISYAAAYSLCGLFSSPEPKAEGELWNVTKYLWLYFRRLELLGNGKHYSSTLSAQPLEV